MWKRRGPTRDAAQVFSAKIGFGPRKTQIFGAASLIDGDLARRLGTALGLASETDRLQRTRSSAGDDSRVAGQVRLIAGLGWVRRHRNIVYLWPEKNRRRREPPLVLRLLEFHDARGSLWLVTNALDLQQLSVRTAQDIYQRRRGVEGSFVDSSRRSVAASCAATRRRTWNSNSTGRW